MAGTIKTKAQLYADAVALPNPITRTALVAHLDNIVASYENIIQEYTTVQRNALTPFEGQKIYNTTSNRLEYYSSSMWLPCSQKETVAVDCSANPNYPEALVGDQYIVTVAGIIGGGSGKTVSVGDLVYCTVANAGGTEASVGTSWKVCYSGGGAQLKKATVLIPTASVLTLNSTPIEIVGAVAGKAIQIVSAVCKINYNSIAYATNTSIKLGASTDVAATPQMTASIAGTFSFWNVFTPVAGGTDLMSDTIVAYVATGNPTAGNSDITIVVHYLEV